MEFASSFLSSWFTPTSLFLLLNLVIGTIFLTARFGAPKHQLGSRDSPPHHHPQLARARSSSLLDRVRSINLSLNKFDYHHQPTAEPDHLLQDPTRLARAPSLLERLKSFRSTKSEPEPELELEPEPEKAPNPKIMTKSASEKINGVEGEDEISVERRRPATTREREKTAEVKREKTASSWCVLDECVDAKADDFINRFKQQLKLQRLESLKRFSDMMKGK